MWYQFNMGASPISVLPRLFDILIHVGWRKYDPLFYFTCIHGNTTRIANYEISPSLYQCHYLLPETNYTIYINTPKPIMHLNISTLSLFDDPFDVEINEISSATLSLQWTSVFYGELLRSLKRSTPLTKIKYKVQIIGKNLITNEILNVYRPISARSFNDSYVEYLATPRPGNYAFSSRMCAFSFLFPAHMCATNLGIKWKKSCYAMVYLCSFQAIRSNSHAFYYCSAWSKYMNMSIVAPSTTAIPKRMVITEPIVKLSRITDLSVTPPTNYTMSTNVSHMKQIHSPPLTKMVSFDETTKILRYFVYVVIVIFTGIVTVIILVLLALLLIKRQKRRDSRVSYTNRFPAEASLTSDSMIQMDTIEFWRSLKPVRHCASLLSLWDKPQ